MLGLDISHKILRTDTVYDYMNDNYNRSDFHSLMTKTLVGEIVLTRYVMVCPSGKGGGGGGGYLRV